MSTKDEQYTEYCKYLHTDRIKLGLICNTGSKDGRSIYRGNLIPPYIASTKQLMISSTIHDNIPSQFICKDIYCCKLCDKKAEQYKLYLRNTCYSEKRANKTIRKHIADNHYEYCYSCDNCYDYFVNKAAFKEHMCKAEKDYDIWS